MERESSIKQLINSSLEQVRSIIDADTVVGKQMVTPSGTVIIPISKIAMGFASGGLDLPSDEEEEVKNFGGGGGTGVTVTPIGFLTVYADGRVEMLPITHDKATTIEQVANLLDQAPSIINRIKDAISGVLPASEEDAAEKEAEYERKLAEDLANEEVLSARELRKRRRLEEKAAKKAAK
ncbi:MAG: sporulation protein YtfJ [Clostridia bacterium]|nr:sporulation protein YtfJ [Clostridia bacterium]